QWEPIVLEKAKVIFAVVDLSLVRSPRLEVCLLAVSLFSFWPPWESRSIVLGLSSSYFWSVRASWESSKSGEHATLVSGSARTERIDVPLFGSPSLEKGARQSPLAHSLLPC